MATSSFQDSDTDGQSRRRPAAPEAALSLRDLVKVLYRRRWVILSVVVLLTGLTVLFALSLEPRYTAVAAVLIEPRKSNVINTASVVVEEDRMSSSTLAAEVNLLRSRTYAEQVVEKLNLTGRPEFNPNLQVERGPLQRVAGRLLKVIPAQWTEAVLAGLDGSFLGSSLADELHDTGRPPVEQVSDEAVQAYAVRTVLNGLEVGPGGEQLIVIKFTATEPDNAASVADKVAELYVEEQLEIKRVVVNKAAEWLRTRVAELRERVLASEEAVETYRVANGLMPGQQQSAVSGPIQDLAEARAQRVAKEELLEWVEELQRQGSGIDGMVSVLSVPGLEALRQQQLDLQRQETMLRTKFGDRHPQIVQLNNETHPISIEQRQLAAAISRRASAAISDLRGQVAFARHRERELESRLAESEQAQDPEGRAEVHLRDLERQANADRSLYVTLLNRLNEVSEQKDLLEPGARVASRAGVPASPEFPKPKLMGAASFIVSLMLGTALALVIEFFDSGMRTGRQIEKILGVPSLGFIPKVGRLKRQQPLHQYLVEKPQSAYAEAIRSVEIATRDAALDQTSQVVVVTSSVPGEGKTTLACSLAASAAFAGRRALIVDLDLRRPQVQRQMERRPEVGLIEYLTGETSLETAIHHDLHQPNLDILPVKRLPASPADLLRSPKMANLIRELRSRYSYIVLDTPPLLGVVDAKMAARLADVILFAVHWEKTTEDIAGNGIEPLLDGHDAALGAVLTQVNVKRHMKRGYGESMQYYSKYEKYYVT